MKITTKENANGRISGYFVDGVKVRKNEIDGIIISRRTEIIEVDYFVGQEFKTLTNFSEAYQLKAIFTGMGDNKLMTEAAAKALGYKIVKDWCGGYRDIVKVAQIQAAEEATQETGTGNEHAEVTAQETDNDDDNVWELIPDTTELNDVDTATAEPESASNTAEPAPADNFAAKLAELKAAADNAKRALAKAQANCNKASAELKNFIDEQAYNLKNKLDALPLASITLKKENGATYRVKNFDDIYIGAYRPGFDVEFHFEFWNGKTLARYETPAQVEAVIARLKEAIARGDEHFTFPTIDDLKPPTFKPDAEWTSLFGDYHYYRIGEEFITFDKAGRFVEVFSKKLGGYYTAKGEFYYKNKSDNPDAIWEDNRHKCTEQTFYQIMTARGTTGKAEFSVIKDEIDKAIQSINAKAPTGWAIQRQFDKFIDKFIVKFNGSTVTSLDSLALQKFLTPQQFFEQFKPLVDKNYSMRHQFINDRKQELDNLISMRKELSDDKERLKTVDKLIEQIKLDLAQTEFCELDTKK